MTEHAAEAVAEVIEDVDCFVLASLQDRTNYRLGIAARSGAVAAPNFAVHDRRLQGLLGAMVGRRCVRFDQKHEPLSPMVVQVLGETLVLGVPARCLRQSIGKAAALWRSILHGEPITHLQGFPEQVDHLLREDFGRATLLVHKAARTPQRMVNALLMAGLLETVIRGATIMSHAA